MARIELSALRRQARALAVVCSLTGLIGLVSVVLPYSASSPRAYMGTSGAVMLGIAAALFLGSERVRPWQLHATLSLVTVAMTVAVALSTTPSGVVVTAVCFLWIAAYSAAQHSPEVLARHLAGVGAGLAVGLWYAGAVSPIQTWLVVMGTYGAVSVVLNRTVQALRREAGTDVLTGVFSRRSFMDAIGLEMHRARRRGDTLSVAIIDLDHFKAINDNGGHAAGDAVLVDLARAWQDELPPESSLGRLGGDEFAVLLPRTTADQARATLSRLSSEPCGWSAGVAQWDGQGVTALLRAADEDLYAAKSARGERPVPVAAGGRGRAWRG